MTLTTISDDGRFLMAGPGSDRLYDRLTGDLTTTPYGRLSGDVRFLATAAGRLEISSGAITPVPASFRSAGEPQPLAISADGAWLAYSVARQSMARPAELYLWNVADGRVRAITSSIPPLPGSPILLIGGTAFSASGRYVTFTINRADVDCTGGAGCGEVYVYDIVSAELRGRALIPQGTRVPVSTRVVASRTTERSSSVPRARLRTHPAAGPCGSWAPTDRSKSTTSARRRSATSTPSTFRPSPSAATAAPSFTSDENPEGRRARRITRSSSTDQRRVDRRTVDSTR